MVTIDRNLERQVEDARVSLREAPPEHLQWVNNLSSLHQRLFAVEIHDAIATFLMRRDEESALCVMELLDSWEATAELDAAPEVGRKIKMAREEKQYVDWSAKG
jgi:hypothetical protein